ncbi:MAG: UvrD-helicase domain-containing protein, partial [Clostridia bacterium]|nr:UvrD-helicase domain-containing protein [Clostridia bacterium]
MTDLFTSLNPAQLSAVTATEGYVRIIAGAGSGKTRTLTHRYAYLVKAAGIHPSNVLCVTFTNKAAGEMKRRVRGLIGDGYDNSLITTYHGFCVRVLREDIFRLFYPQSFVILDEGDQKRLLSEIYGEMDLKMDRATFEKILDLVHRLKSDEGYVDRLVNGETEGIHVPPIDPTHPPEPLEVEIIRRYLAKQKKIFGLDFDDLVAFAFTIFRKFPEVREKWAERLYYIQVDEFQDSSARELRLLTMLSETHRNLFVVGDPDQNIYEWRGADMSILVDFDKTFPGTRTIMLNQNYRSTGHILNCANTLIAKNKNRIPKDLFTAGGGGMDVIHLHAMSEAEEGRYITEEIRRLHGEGLQYKQIAILYRAGFLSRFAEQALMNAGIPYELYGSVRFYERMEIRDALAYLKLLRSDDDEALERVINTPKRSFGKAKMAALRSFAFDDRCSLLEALRRYQTSPVFARSGAAAFVSLIDGLRKDALTRPASEVIGDVLTGSGYEDYIRQNGSMERLDNLAEFKRTAWQKEQEYGEAYTLDLFLQQVTLESDREDEEEADRVKLMTIHASKGLEFPVCFVTGMTEGIFPSGRTLEERKEAGLEEERRLCFVALTRAMQRLYLTESEGTSDDSTHRAKRPSRFLYDIGEQNYVRIGVIPKELAESSEETVSSGASGTLSIGSVVNHPVFGRGTVVETDTGKRVYYILFESGSRRPVSMEYDFAAGEAMAALRDAAMAAAQSAETVSPAEEIPEGQPAQPEAAAEPIPEPEEPDVHEDMVPEWGEDPTDGVLSTDMFPVIPAEWELPPIPETPSMPDIPPVPENLPAVPQEPESGMSAPAQPKGEMPVRYRNAEWAREPDGIADGMEENLWKRDDVPHEGWECTGIIDLGEPVGICRMCGHQIIRYVHIMRHPDYHRTIGAGCICAGRMEGDVERAKQRENDFKNRQNRLETFLALPRKRSRNGHEYVKYKGEIITLLEDKFSKGHWKTAVRTKSSAPFATTEEALRAV